MIKKVKKINLSLQRLLSCSSTARSNKFNDKKMLYLIIMKTNNNLKKASNRMKTFKVTYNKNEVVFNDNNRQAMFKSDYHMNKDYIETTNANAFSITMIARDYLDCLEKAKNLFKEKYNKLANSIEVKTIQKATIASNEIKSNQLKLVA